MADPMPLSDSALKERELQLKTRELELKAEEIAQGRRMAIWVSAPIAVAVVGGLITWIGSLYVEQYKARQAREATEFQAALDIVKAAAAPEKIEKSRTNLRFIIEVEIGPQHLRDKLKAYLDKPDAPLPSEVGVAGALQARMPAGSDAPSAPPSSSSVPSGDEGWFYLGKVDSTKTKWVNSSALRTFGIVPDNGGNDVQPVEVGTPYADLNGKTIRTLATKYLRDGGVPGKRVQSPVKRTLSSGTTLKIVEIDDVGEDAGEPVLWAKVKVQS